jgi:NNP family nitrate/nitrite transporter-like MFS transporter
MSQEFFHTESHPSTASTTTSNEPHIWWLIACAFCCFGVWSSWSVVVVLLLQTGASYSVSALFSLLSISGLAGASLHIALGLLIPPGSARPLLMLCISFLLIPATLLCWLPTLDAPLWTLQLAALFCGLGGGSFSAFITSVCHRLPRSRQATTLGLGKGLAHLGMAASQLLLPLLVSVRLWNGAQASPLVTGQFSTLLGSDNSREVWLQQSFLLWPLLLILLLLFAMKNFRSSDATRRETLYKNIRYKSTGYNGIGALGIGLGVSAIGLWLTLSPEASGAGLQLSRELVLVAVALTMLVLLRFLFGAQHPVFALFNNRHTWSMSLLYAMSLGSFLGLACALPLTLELVFGYISDGDLRLPNPNAPGVFTYIWMGPLLGVLAQPVGTWLARRFGSATVTQSCALVMMLSAACSAYYLSAAYQATEPEQYFLTLLMLIFILFAAAGSSYAALSLAMPGMFSSRQLLHARLWLTGIASYGMFYIPHLLGEQIAQGTPAQAMIGFALFYGLCLLVNGWFYQRCQRAV